MTGGIASPEWWDIPCTPETRTHVCEEVDERFEKFYVPGKAPDFEIGKT